MKKLLFVIIVLVLFSSACSGIDGKGLKDQGDLRLDPASKECVSCHEAERFIKSERAGPVHTPHIIGLDYRSASGRDPTLTRAALLDTALRLIDGKVSCITCHVEYLESAHTGPMLTVDNSGSGLCRKCHKK